jgi:carbon storage regulator CsrA
VTEFTGIPVRGPGQRRRQGSVFFAGKEAITMLVLTRRENERILLPDIGVTVELMSVSGNRARLGISAPDNIRILREEVAADRQAIQQAANRGPISRDFVHAMRNRLNAAMLAAEMLRLQIHNGTFADPSEPLEKIFAELKALGTLLQAERPVAAPRVESRRSRPLRALLVEDDANESNLLAGILRMTGFEVDTAGDGADALDYLRSHDRPDVVLLDMLMPRCDGPTTVGRIRRDPSFEGMKIFAVSGTSPKRCGVTTGPTGVDRWFSKPLDPRELVQQLNSELAATGETP